VELGLDIIRLRASSAIIVAGQKGKTDRVGEAVLKEGMEDLFESIGKQLGEILLQKTPTKVRAAT
jgi:hypothetical protein